VANADWQAHRFEIPQARDGQRWCRFIDTALDAPRDICEEGEEFQLEDQQGYEVADRTVIVLIAG
ncbi:MAG: hypothetical protein GY868_15140, partial [Deltaproteobacteria bacterium]|nr:hypothetical protein [Deltaproteobacteria bacterium]